jgi:hypothetical protein
MAWQLVGHVGEHLTQVGTHLADGRPVRPWRVFSLDQQQGEVHEELVQGITLTGPRRYAVPVIELEEVGMRLGNLPPP